jgi:transcriptional regulator with XRE-family HTH domain
MDVGDKDDAGATGGAKAPADAPSQPQPAAPPALDLGSRLRAERLGQGMSLREMARRLGVSASALSQIETGKAQPSVNTLFDIVNLLNTSLDGLLAGNPAARGAGKDKEPDGHGPAPELARRPELEGFFSFQRAGEHETLSLESGVRWHRLTEGSLPGVEFLHVLYEPGACSSADGAYMRHAGQEFGYVISGRLMVDIGFDAYELAPGDTVSFPATTPHRLSNKGAEPTTAIWVVIGRHAS